MFNFMNQNSNMTNNENCNNNCNNNSNNYCYCKKQNQTTYKECEPIVTCSEEVIDQYHVTRQPYIHNYHTKVVHHYITENYFIPRYTCSEVHINEDSCNRNNQ